MVEYYRKSRPVKGGFLYEVKLQANEEQTATIRKMIFYSSLWRL
jgi:hypothetical protein